MHNHLVMMAIDVGVDAVETFEELADCRREMFRERHADAGWEGGFVIDVGLDPGHEVLDVFWGGHFGGFGVAGGGVLPEVFKSVGVSGRCQNLGGL